MKAQATTTVTATMTATRREEEGPQKLSRVAPAPTTMSASSQAYAVPSKSDKPGELFQRTCCRCPLWLTVTCSLVLPLALVAALSWTLLSAEARTYDSALRIRQNIHLTVVASDFIHAAQRERGITGGFIASGLQSSGPQLLTLYNETNKAANALLFFLSSGVVQTGEADPSEATSLPTSYHSSVQEFVSSVADIRDGLNMLIGLRAHRLAVWAGQRDADAGTAYYSKMNALFLSANRWVAANQGTTDIERAWFALLAVSNLKENAGRERGTGSFVAASGGFASLNLYQQFATVVSAQDVHDGNLLTFATPTTQKLYKDTVVAGGAQTSAAVSLAISLRGNLLSNVSSLFPADPMYWYGNTTARINAIRTVESAAAAQVRYEAEGARDYAMGQTAILLGVVGGGLVVYGTLLLSSVLAVSGLWSETSKVATFRSRVYLVSQVITTTALPLLVTLALCVILLNTRASESRMATKTRADVDFALLINNLIHEAQKERGLSGLYTGSAGTRFFTDWRQQVAICNQRRLELLTFLGVAYPEAAAASVSAWLPPSLDSNSAKVLADHGRGLKESFMGTTATADTLTAALNALLQIDTHRQQVFSLTRVGLDALSGYTSLIRQWTTVMGILAARQASVTSDSSSSSLGLRLLSYLTFTYGKEEVGKQRMRGNIAYTQGGVFANLAAYRTFAGILAVQDGHLGNFVTYAEAAPLSTWNVAILAGTAGQGTARLRSILLSNSTQAGSAPVAAGSPAAIALSGQWWGNITAQIDQMRALEAVLADRVQVFFEEVRSRYNLWIAVVGGLVGMLAVADVALFVSSMCFQAQVRQRRQLAAAAASSTTTAKQPGDGDKSAAEAAEAEDTAAGGLHDL